MLKLYHYYSIRYHYIIINITLHCRQSLLIFRRVSSQWQRTRFFWEGGRESYLVLDTNTVPSVCAFICPAIEWMNGVRCGAYACKLPIAIPFRIPIPIPIRNPIPIPTPRAPSDSYNSGRKGRQRDSLELRTRIRTVTAVVTATLRLRWGFRIGNFLVCMGDMCVLGLCADRF